MSKEADMSISVSTLFPGFRFSPTDAELISYYLRRKIDGDENSVAVIAEVEIYKFEPWDLPGESKLKSENEWFYFCARGRKYPHGSQSRRATQLGYWKATGKERNVKTGNQIVGTKRTLVFHIGRAPRGQRTEWIMHEYCINDTSSQDALVVCRLRKNSDFRTTSSRKHIEDNHHVDVPEPDTTPNSYSPHESEHKLLNDDLAESSNAFEEQVDSDDDCYAEIMKDDIIELDEVAAAWTTGEALKANQTVGSNHPISQETIVREALSTRSEECAESNQRMNCYALFRINNNVDLADGWRILNPFRIKNNNDIHQGLKNVITKSVFLVILLVSVFLVVLTAKEK